MSKGKYQKWLAANQPGRTRDWHSELDESEAEVDEPFKNSYGDGRFFVDNLNCV